MYTVGVRDQIMIAHSLRGAVFGPSQRMHGATFVVDLTVRGPGLTRDGILVDIGDAAAHLRAVLDGLDRRNLDELPAFADRNSTTEAVARWVADRVAERLSAPTVTALTVTVHESPTAWASYEREVRAP